MNFENWTKLITALGSIATPIIVLGLTSLGWRFKSRIERRLSLEDKMRDERVSSYAKLLEPFVILLTTDAAWNSNSANKGKDKAKVFQDLFLSHEYRSQVFKMTMIGSDAVVKSYNALMQYVYKPESPDKNAKAMISLLGAFLLEIRRSSGSEQTTLMPIEMLEWLLTDAKAYK